MKDLTKERGPKPVTARIVGRSRIVVIILSMILSSCAGPTTDQPEPEKETIAVFTKNQVNPFFQAIRLGAENAAKQMGANVVHYVPTKPDSIPE